jgi:hydroxyacylglutathione hydrolase
VNGLDGAESSHLRPLPPICRIGFASLRRQPSSGADVTHQTSHTTTPSTSRLDVELIPIFSDNYVYRIAPRRGGPVAIVDPGLAAPVLERLAATGDRVECILITHHHPDHVGGLAELKQATGAVVFGPAADQELIPGIDRPLREGDRITVAGDEAVVFETPGHTSGHVSYWFEAARALFCADTLFSLGCGRLFEGTPATMWSSLEKLLRLPDDARVYCGHEYTQSNARFALTIDPDNEALRRRAAEIDQLRAAGMPTIPTTLGLERATNPFLRPHDAAIRARLGMESATDAEVFGEIRKRKDNA